MVMVLMVSYWFVMGFVVENIRISVMVSIVFSAGSLVPVFADLIPQSTHETIACKAHNTPTAEPLTQAPPTPRFHRRKKEKLRP